MFYLDGSKKEDLHEPQERGRLKYLYNNIEFEQRLKNIIRYHQ
jgi:predicted transcriptional regulator